MTYVPEIEHLTKMRDLYTECAECAIVTMERSKAGSIYRDMAIENAQHWQFMADSYRTAVSVLTNLPEGWWARRREIRGAAAVLWFADHVNEARKAEGRKALRRMARNDT